MYVILDFFFGRSVWTEFRSSEQQSLESVESKLLLLSEFVSHDLFRFCLVEIGSSTGTLFPVVWLPLASSSILNDILTGFAILDIEFYVPSKAEDRLTMSKSGPILGFYSIYSDNSSALVIDTIKTNLCF